MNAYFNLNKIIKKRRGGDQSTDCTVENGLKSVQVFEMGKWKVTVVAKHLQAKYVNLTIGHFSIF